MSIILTGFMPFGGLSVNPSQLIVEQIASQSRYAHLVTEILPVEYHHAGRRIRELIQAYQPHTVLCLGLAQRRNGIHIERVALNLDDAAIVDNAGDLASGRLIDPDGPPAYWSTLPIEAIVSSLQSRGIPAVISNHAGTYVCNHVFYMSRRELDCAGSQSPCGFIHVPAMRDLDDPSAGLPLSVMVEAVECCLDVLGVS